MTKRPPPDDPARDTLVDARRTKLGVGTASEPADAPEEVSLTGTVVGGYLVDEELGRGAMGVVYRARHLDTNRIVALKVIRPHILDEETIVQRFRREARIASRLGHPHVGGLVDLIETEGRYALALELVEGEPLTSIVTMPLPPERVIVIAGQLLRGLEHAHAMGLIHRDLKPDNVLVEWRNQRDHARIIDFGIAIARDGTAETLERLTATGHIVGTPIYMAPEQARGEELDARADLYSVGVMTYEMLTGKAPFEGRPLEILVAKLKRDIPAMGERVPGLIVDPLLEQWCRRLLSREPAQRFDSARHALTVLDYIAADPAAAGPALGLMDVEKALAVISLPDAPPTRKP